MIFFKSKKKLPIITDNTITADQARILSEQSEKMIIETTYLDIMKAIRTMAGLYSTQEYTMIRANNYSTIRYIKKLKPRLEDLGYKVEFEYELNFHTDNTYTQSDRIRLCRITW